MRRTRSPSGREKKRRELALGSRLNGKERERWGKTKGILTSFSWYAADKAALERDELLARDDDEAPCPTENDVDSAPPAALDLEELLARDERWPIEYEAESAAAAAAARDEREEAPERVPREFSAYDAEAPFPVREDERPEEYWVSAAARAERDDADAPRLPSDSSA